MRVKIDHCEICHKEQIMAYKESYKHCLTCDTHFQSVNCGNCRCGQTIFYSSSTEFIEFECPRCHEQMWAEIMFGNLEYPIVILHLGFRNVTDNK
jgi:hypothetical protein